MPEPTPEAWAQIRHDYEHTDKPIVEICFEHEITAPMLRYRVKCWDWRRRKPLVPRHGPPPVEVIRSETVAPTTAPIHPTPPAFVNASAGDPPPPGEGEGSIVPRLQAAAARILPAIEATIARLASGELDSRDLEKTGRTLATLTRTLRELNALLLQQDAPLQPDDDPVPKDIDEFRFELARRIRGFIEARKNEHCTQPEQAAGPEGPATAVDGPAPA